MLAFVVFDSMRASRGREATPDSLPVMMIKGEPRTNAMERHLEFKPQVIKWHVETFDVNVLPSWRVCLITHLDDLQLGARLNGRVLDPSENSAYGLVEVKCADVKDDRETSHTELLRVISP